MRPAQGEHYRSVPTRVWVGEIREECAEFEVALTFLAIKTNGDERGQVADARRRVENR